jgi:hypothetical protein
LSARRRPLAIVVAALAVAGQAHADKAPAVVLSPQTAASAPVVDANIAEVTVFSDRARIRRRGRAPGKAGVELVRFPGLPGAVQLDTIRVSANGGRVLRVEATPVQRERLSIEQAGKLLDALDAGRRSAGGDGRPPRGATTGRSASCARSARRRPSPRRSARDARTWFPTSRRGGRR